MCGRESDSTTRPAFLADTLADRPAEAPDPVDHSYGYRVTEEGLQALAEYEERHGRPLFRKVRLPDTVAEGLADEAWRERRRQFRKEARARGNRLVTICGRRRGGRKVPELRLIGQWLERTGFDLGRHCEIEATPGTLTIRVV